MNIEAELPVNFDELSNDEKIEELEKLKADLSGDSDSEVLKRRMVEELIESYR